MPKNELLNPSAEPSRDQLIKEKALRRGKDGKKKELPSSLTPTVTCKKNTLAHKATVEARDRAYKVSARSRHAPPPPRPAHLDLHV